MTKKTERASDYKTCPLKWKAASDVGALVWGTCDGPCCAWWDAVREKCDVLPK